MSSQEQSRSRSPSFLTRDQVEALYQRCCAREQELRRRSQEAEKQAFVSGLTFGPLLLSDGQLEAPLSASDSDELRAWKNQFVAEKYRELVRHLKSARSRGLDQLYQVLAMWLNDEGICKPRDFLPEDVMHLLTDTPRHELANYKPSDKYLADSVEIWISYCELLLRAYKDSAPRPSRRAAPEVQIGNKLIELGFYPAAVRVVVYEVRKTRTAHSLACRFVADRNNVDEGRVGQAHSRIYGRRRQVSTDEDSVES
jgi:hypothetical protein